MDSQIGSKNWGGPVNNGRFGRAEIRTLTWELSWQPAQLAVAHLQFPSSVNLEEPLPMTEAFTLKVKPFLKLLKMLQFVCPSHREGVCVQGWQWSRLGRDLSSAWAVTVMA